MKTSQAGKHGPVVSALGLGCIAYPPLGRDFFTGRSPGHKHGAPLT